MNQLIEDSIALLRRMVATPSESFQEEAVCKLISAHLDSWGIQHRVVGHNIVATNLHFNPDLPTLAMDAHIDTVPPAGGYTFDPYDNGNEPGVVRGLGANDDGGSVVAMIAVFRHLYDADLPVNLALTLSCEEERSGSDGARLLYEKGGIMESLGVKWVIIGEPTGMRAATSERGLLVLDGLASGVSGHAARDEGINALYIAIEDIAALRSYCFDKTSPTMGKVKLSVTQINAGTAHNVVPDSCSFVVDIRPTDCYSPQEIFSQLEKVCKSKLTPRNLANRSSSTPAESPLLKAACATGIETFSSPTTSNWLRIGCDAIKMGPGESSRSHHSDEFILCSEIEQAYYQYIDYINAFYGYAME